MTFHIRAAKPDDASELKRLWQERRDVYLKTSTRAFKPQTADDWMAVVNHWLSRDDAAVLVADRDGQLIGYMVGWKQSNLPMLQPAHYGLVTEMSVDGHCKQGGVGTAMLKEMKAWFKARNLEQVEVRVPRLNPIEQAFWRSLKTSDQFDTLWLKLE